MAELNDRRNESLEVAEDFHQKTKRKTPQKTDYWKKLKS